MAVHFSPKILGLNAGIFRTISDSPGLDFLGYFRTVRNWIFRAVLDSPGLNLRTIFGQSEIKFLGLFWAVPGLIFGLLLVHVLCFCVLLLKK